MDAAIADWRKSYKEDLDSTIAAWSCGRGGVHQQLAALVTAGISDPAPKQQASALATLLAEQNSWGLMSAELVQKIAAAAVYDGADHPEVVTMSRLGATRNRTP